MVLAVIGTAALWLTFVWLASAIAASMFSAQKGYGEKVGLVTGTMGTVVGAFVWAVWPAREISHWSLHEGLGSSAKTVLACVEAVIVIGGIFAVISIDASGVGKFGLVLLVVMVAVIAAALVKVGSISQSTGTKTLAEMRAEREAKAQAFDKAVG
jgi:hypothetical protein